MALFWEFVWYSMKLWAVLSFVVGVGIMGQFIHRVWRDQYQPPTAIRGTRNLLAKRPQAVSTERLQVPGGEDNHEDEDDDQPVSGRTRSHDNKLD